MFSVRRLTPNLGAELSGVDLGFGEVQVHVMNQYHADGFPELYRGTLAWHTDGSWQRVTGQATIIYDAAWKARIAGLRAVHNLDFSRTRRHGEDPLTEGSGSCGRRSTTRWCARIPKTGRKCLYLGDHAEYIVSMPYDDGRALIEELNALAVHADLGYEHRWTPRRRGESYAAAPCSGKLPSEFGVRFVIKTRGYRLHT